MKLIYGLGNPGKEYTFTRHNVGYMVLDLLGMSYGIQVKMRSKGMVFGKGIIQGIDVVLAKPTTYMNLSGDPLRSIDLDPSDLIVVHDDMDIPLGEVRVKKGGGTGGHKGVKSIMDSIGTDEFVRVRCGIGRPEEAMDAVDYVLSPFSKDQMVILRKELDRASDAVEACIVHGTEYAMNAFNRRV